MVLEKRFVTKIPTIIDPSATEKHPSATGSIIVGISVPLIYLGLLVVCSALVLLGARVCMCSYLLLYLSL